MKPAQTLALLLHHSLRQARRYLLVGLCGLLLVGGLQLAVASPALAAEDIQQNLCGGANLQLTPGDCEGDEAETQLDNTLRNAINLFSIAAGIASVIMLLYAGFRYIVSGGSAEGVKGARSAITYVIIGIVIVALSQIIVRFVLDRLVSS